MLLETSKQYEQDNYWSQHLLWLLENRPEFVKNLFEKDRMKLRLYISRKVEQSLELLMKLKAQKSPDAEAEEVVLAQVIAPPPPENPPEPLPDPLKSRILLWSENLPA